MSKTAVLAAAHAEVSVLETLRLDEHGAGHLAAHLDRLLGTAEWLGVPFDRDGRSGASSRLTSDAHGRATASGARPEGRADDHPGADRTPRRRRCAWRSIRRDTVRRPDVPAQDHMAPALRRGPGALARGGRRRARQRARPSDRDHRGQPRLPQRRPLVLPPLTEGVCRASPAAQALAGWAPVANDRCDAADLAVCDKLAVINDLRGWRPAHLLDPASA